VNAQEPENLPLLVANLRPKQINPDPIFNCCSVPKPLSGRWGITATSTGRPGYPPSPSLSHGRCPGPLSQFAMSPSFDLSHSLSLSPLLAWSYHRGGTAVNPAPAVTLPPLSVTPHLLFFLSLHVLVVHGTGF